MTEELPERFQAVFRQHYPTVLRRLTRLVGDRMVAEDIAQEAFLRLYRTPPNELDAIGAWLHRVATRLGYDYIRQQSSQRRMEEKEQAQSGLDAMEPPSDVMVMRNQDRESVKRVLQQLSERDRQALLLRYSGYTYAEIAEIVGVTPEFVGTVLRRALGRFKKQYRGQEGLSDGETWTQGKHLV